jgi:putative transposase
VSWSFRAISLAGRGAEGDEGIAFTEAQKAFIIKQGEDGTPVAEICRKAGIS